MTHYEIQERLDEFLDGMLPREEAMLVETHLATCEACRREKESLAELLARAGELPREIAPPRDLWLDIAARLDQRRIPLRGLELHAADTTAPAAEPQVISLDARRAARSTRRAAWMAWGVRAAAALALIVLSSTITAVLMRQGPQEAQLATQQAAPARPGITALVAFEPTEAEYIRTADDLAAVLDSRRHLLAPETARVVEENLRIIDRAIAEARAALEADPNNVDLTHMLGGTYQQKIEMLQHAAQLPLRI
ncbi:MAG TPA: zf-HC2 domain-containing protein [Longimicrobiaceae bacterium]|nr:zf-HC2 domain-containing protein [Longimicrobiaceae bacterium]